MKDNKAYKCVSTLIHYKFITVQYLLLEICMQITYATQILFRLENIEILRKEDFFVDFFYAVYASAGF